MNVYQIVTQKILEKIEQGVIPWRKPWVSRGQAVNWLTQKEYRGINTMLLDPGEYATFNQIKEHGGKVKKGAKSQIVVFWKWIEKENEETGQTDKIPFLRYYNVFEINTQCEGLESRRKDSPVYEHDPIIEAEKIVQGYMDAPPIRYASGRAYYQPAGDFISVPPLQDYPNIAEYYSTLFHELTHSTGHIKRLARPGVLDSAAAFGSEVYSKEELVAEMGAVMLCGVAGFVEITIDNSAAYIKSWSRKLKEDSRLVVMAASQAQKAADYILGKSNGETEE